MSQSAAPLGTEILVNTATQGNQGNPQLSWLPGGGFVVVWEDLSQGVGGAPGDSSGYAIKGQLFGPDGARIGDEFLVNSSTTGDQVFPTVVTLAGGGFVVVWTDEGHASGGVIRAQLFSQAGNRIGSEILVNTVTQNIQDQPIVAALSDGGFAIGWRDDSGLGGDASLTGVKAQVFDGSGAKVGDEMLVNTATPSFQLGARMAAIDDGRFVVTWRDFSAGQGGATGDTSGWAVKAQILASDGTRIGSEILVNTAIAGDQDRPEVAALVGGGFVIVWHDDSAGVGGAGGDASGRAVKGQRFDADGAKLGGEFLVNTATEDQQEFPLVAGLVGGGFVVAWTDFSQGVGGAAGDGSNAAIKAQVYGADGAKIGGEILVNTATLNAQILAQIEALEGGGFVVAWEDFSGGIGGAGGDNSDFAVKAQVFDAMGGRIGNELLVNTATDNFQGVPYVTAIEGGGFAVAWNDGSLGSGGAEGDTSGSAVKAQIFQVGVIPIMGTGFADFLDGTPGDDIILGLGGNDVLRGLEGNDQLFGGDGDDQLFGGDGVDILFGGAGNDFLDAGGALEERDDDGNLVGGFGNVLVPGSGSNTVVVRSALDIIDNGYLFEDHPGRPSAVNEIISYSDFWWDLYGAGSTLVLPEAAAGSYELSAMIGWLFDSEIVGNSGDNVIFTVGGDNVVRPGAGVGWIALGVTDGYRGTDTLVIDKVQPWEATSWAIVWDFMPGEDKIDLSDLGLGSFEEVRGSGFEVGGSTALILDGTSNVLFLVELELGALSEDDFII